MASSSPLVEIANSSFLDYTGYRITQLTSVENAYGISDGQLFDSADAATPFNMALVLQRQQDPSELLAQPWASRQRQLEQLRRDGNLWKRYGADQEMFAAFQNDLRETYNFKLLGDSDNYVSSPESRTVWIKIDSGKKFEDLFGTSLYYSGSQGLAYWKGNLSFPKDWVNEIAGLWPDVDTAPQASNFTPDTAATLPLGPQSPGNATAIPPSLAPQTIAASLYNFPLAGAAHATGPIGLIEPAVGTGLPKDPTGDGFATLLQEYLQAVGQTSLDGSVDVAVQGINAQSGNSSAERSIDIGIVSAVNPNSPFIFFNGSGSGTVFTAAQSAAWWGSNQQAPQVTTNSWGDSNSMTPGSPFYNAYWGIFEDAALNNQTTLIALGDGGSGNETGNGITNVEMNITQPYNLIVSGTSLSTLQSAKADPTLNGHGNLPITPLALSQDRATLWSLMQAGLSTLPNEASSADRFLEAVWNSYEVFSDGASGRYLIKIGRAHV